MRENGQSRWLDSTQSNPIQTTIEILFVHKIFAFAFGSIDVKPKSPNFTMKYANIAGQKVQK
jgi:hypothetical protein